MQLLLLLKEINARLTAFSFILNWAASSMDCGYHFKAACQPSQERRVRMQNLSTRCNMMGLKPKEKQLHLSYSKGLVSMVCFDACQVLFASLACLLSCATLNTDANLSITLDSSDIDTDQRTVASMCQPMPQAIDSPLLAGRGFSNSIDTCDHTPKFAWNRKGPSENPEKVRLSVESMRYIAQH